MAEILKRPERKFVSDDFEVNSWELVEPYLNKLKSQSVDSEMSLRAWFQNRSELESVLSEDFAWRYIKMTCDTTDKEREDAYTFFVTEVHPKLAPFDDELNKIAVSSPALEALSTQKGFDILIRDIKNSIELFREENIPLQTELSQLTQKYGSIAGAMTIDWEGEELTLQQASIHLKSTDRAIREKAFKLISGRRLNSAADLNDLFNKLIVLRDQVAKNAGFENFRDYKFRALGRFDYTKEDCFQFHEAIEHETVPLLKGFTEERKKALGLELLKPWDTAVDLEGREPLKAFESSDALLDKTIEAFTNIDPYFGDCIATMKEMGHLDLSSRKGKAPGGYNYPLAEIGAPFIFMNATSQLRDLVTMVHEGGHAIHSFLSKDLELSDFKNTPSEVAELASMSMELISMDQWHLFFADKDELKRAKIEQLEQVIETLPWVAIIDKFQHWIYENPKQTDSDREEAWLEILAAYSSGSVDWSGFEDSRKSMWQKQLHLFEVPFYYIEYAMAQLGAIAVYRNYRRDPKKAVEAYKSALSLGNLVGIREVYTAAGVEFNFSRPYIKELMDFVHEELKQLKNE